VEDIPELVAHFSEKAANRFGLPNVLPTADDIRMLQAYSWPGNIRELGAVLDRAAILGNGQRLDISTALGLGAAPTAAPRAPSSIDPLDSRSLSTLDDAIRRHIESALEQSRGRIEGPRGAAAVLDINPHTLRAKMRKLGIAWSEFRK
jgi:DNA-binding NtrC family response regulator